MKIAPREVGSFLKKPADGLRGILLFGPDEGHVRESVKALTRHYLGEGYDPLNLTELTGDHLKEDPARLADELNALSLLGGDRLVWLRDPSATQSKLIKELLIEGNPEAMLLVSAGELQTSSALRQLFEKEKTLASLAFYRDEGRQLSGVIQERFRELQIQAEPDVIPLMMRLLGNDRAVTLSEIDKIDLFLGDERRLSAQHVTLLLGDNSELTLDDLCQAVAGGQPQNIPPLLSRLTHSGTQPIGVYRILYNHFLKLQQLQGMVASGASVDEALKRLRIFYKQQDAMRAQLQRWNGAALLRALEALLQGEKELKTSRSSAAEILCAGLLQRLSLHAARRG